MSYIGVKPKTAYDSVKKDRFTSTTGTTVTLSHAVSSVNDILVWVNGVKQDYTNYSVSSTTLTLGGTLVSSDIVEVAYLGRTYGSVVPNDGSVGTSALQDDAVTAAKLSSTAVDNTNINSTLITAQTEKTSLVDADKFLISDSAASGALKYVQKSNLPSGTHVKLLGGTASSAVNQDFTGYVDTSKYSQYLVTLNNVVGLTSNSFTFAFITSSGSVTSAYYNWVVNGWKSSGSAQTYQGEGATTGKLGTPLAGAGTASGTYHFWLSHNPNGTGYGNSLFGANWGYRSDITDYTYTNFSIGYSEAITTTGFRIYADGNDATTFDYVIYGIAK
tara:strand:+ start:723 stop:1715 length:993 start_codon:yes stop_codon:yes gene_type:complete